MVVPYGGIPPASSWVNNNFPNPYCQLRVRKLSEYLITICKDKNIHSMKSIYKTQNQNVRACQVKYVSESTIRTLLSLE